ncbi:MAG: TAXI family TRAP transporter solute-binding subunit [Rhodospirillaceae bacterium]
MRAARTVCLFIGVVAALSACTRAPSDDTLKTDLQTVIDAGLAPGLIEVDDAARAGGSPLVWGERALIDFEAALRLKRDHRFGAWDELNVGALALMLDAAPQDISGVKVKGNVAGDVITVRGRLAYLETDGGGLKLDTTPPAPAPSRERGLVLLSDLQRAIDARLRAFKETLRASSIGLYLEEWNRARRVIAGRNARRSGGFSIATDTKRTDYWRLGEAAARAAREQDVPFANIAADGPQEALDFLRAGRVTAAVVRNTEAMLAVNGLAPFEASGPYKLAALAALYPQPIHVVVKQDSTLGSPAELFGKHVGVAGTARVNATEAEAILRGHGVPLGALAAPLLAVPAAEALDQLEAGAFDALIMTAALPGAELRSFAARRPVRLLPFDSDAIAFLTTGVGNYVAITIPARTYPGQARPLATVASVTMLVSVDTVPEIEAAGLTDFLLSRTDYLRGGSLTGAMVSRADAERSMTLPWHPGALKLFEPPPKDEK